MDQPTTSKQAWFPILAIVAVALLIGAATAMWYVVQERRAAVGAHARAISTAFVMYAFDNKRAYPDHAGMLAPYLSSQVLTHPFGPLPGHVPTFTAPPIGPVYRLGDFIFPYMPGTKLGGSGSILVISVKEPGAVTRDVAYDDGSVQRFLDDASFVAALDADNKGRRAKAGLPPLTLADIEALETPAEAAP